MNIKSKCSSTQTEKIFWKLLPEICRQETGTLIAPPLQKARVQQISNLFLKTADS